MDSLRVKQMLGHDKPPIETNDVNDIYKTVNYPQNSQEPTFAIKPTFGVRKAAKQSPRLAQK